jgi:hypothetical protein
MAKRWVCGHQVARRGTSHVWGVCVGQIVGCGARETLLPPVIACKDAVCKGAREGMRKNSSGLRGSGDVCEGTHQTFEGVVMACGGTHRTFEGVVVAYEGTHRIFERPVRVCEGTHRTSEGVVMACEGPIGPAREW